MFLSSHEVAERLELHPAVNGHLDVLAGGHVVSSLVAIKSPRVLGGTSSGCAVGEPVALSAGGDDVGVVTEPIEEGDGGGLVG